MKVSMILLVASLGIFGLQSYAAGGQGDGGQGDGGQGDGGQGDGGQGDGGQGDGGQGDGGQGDGGQGDGGQGDGGQGDGGQGDGGQGDRGTVCTISLKRDRFAAEAGGRLRAHRQVVQACVAAGHSRRDCRQAVSCN